MKKILSFTLVLAMILGSVSFCFAATYPVTAASAFTTEAPFVDVKATDDCYEALTVLKAIGAVDGTSEGRFQPEYTLTRAQIVAFIVKALGYPVTEGNSYVTKFADVPATEWYAGYVYWATNLGIVEGRTATKFDPNAKVTADEATAFILRILGYSDNIVGGYPAGYIVAANKLGFYDVISAGSAAVTRGETAQLVYAIADDAIGYVAKETYKGEVAGRWYALTPKETIYTIHGCEVYTQNNEAAELLVDKNVIYRAAEYFGFDASKYFGMTGYVVVKGLAGNKALVESAITSTLTKAEIKTLQSKVKIAAFIPTTTFVTGYTGTTKTTAVLGGYEFDGNANTTYQTIINGYYISGGASFNFKPTETDTNTYAVKIDPETNLITDVVSCATEVVTGYVYVNDATGLANVYTAAKVDETTGAVTAAKGTLAPKMVLDAKGNNTAVVDYTGVELVGIEKYEDIKVGDMLAIYKAQNVASNGIVKVEVYNNTVTGYPSAEYTKNKVDYVTIEGKDYVVAAADKAATYANNEAEKYDSVEYTFFLNKEGQLIAAVPVAEIKPITGLFLSAKTTGYGKDAVTTVEVLTADGTVASYETEKATYWTGLTAGTPISYRLVEGKLGNKVSEYSYNGLTPVKTTTTGAFEVNDKGVVEVGPTPYVLNDNTVVFVYTAPATTSYWVNPVADAANWTVVKGSALAGADLASLAFYTENKTVTGSSYVDVAVVTLDVAATKAPVYVFTAMKELGYREDFKYEFTALNLMTGKTETFYSDTISTLPNGYKNVTVNPYTGTMMTTVASITKDKEIVNGTVTLKYEDGKLFTTTVPADAVTKNTTWTFAGDVAEDAVVYTYTKATTTADASWTVSKVSDLKFTKVATTSVTVKCYKNFLTEESVGYDLFIIEK